MKKLVLAVAMFMSVASLTFAQPLLSSVVIVSATEAMQDDFKEVSVENLNDNVKATVTGYEEGYTVKKLEYSDSLKQTRVTLEDKSSKAEKIVILDDDGKEVK